MPEPEVTREDLKRVETRVEFVAQEVEGEKLLSRYILQQTRQNGDDLAILKARTERIEQKLETEVRAVRSDLNALRNDFNAAQAKLPGMIAEVMREVLRETRG